MKDCVKIVECRLCKHPYFTSRILLPDTPLANEYLDKPEPQDTFPLEVVSCDNCGHYQLSVTVSPERLFKHYLYVAGTSPVNVKHFNQYADDMIERFNLQPNDLVVEIASNDGIMLKHFQSKGMKVLGIDPAENLAQLANGQGVETIPEFFTSKLAEDIVKKHGRVKFACANNVLAHLDNFDEVFEGIDKLLAPDGIFSFEVSYFKDVVDKMLFDLIYHEHTSQHLVSVLEKYFQSRGIFTLFDVQKLPNHGGSIRCFLKKTSNHTQLFSYRVLDCVLEELDIVKKVSQYQISLQNIGQQLKDKISEYKQQNKSIAIYGVPAKSTTLMYVFGLDKFSIDFAVDDATLKQGRFTPGTHIPIYHPDEIYKRNPDVILVLGWNFADSIIRKHSNFKGKWIVPLPELREI